MLTPYVAYLRVYQPLAAFPSAERERWSAYASAVAAPPTGRHHRAAAGPDRAVEESRQALVALAVTPPVLVPEVESGEAYVLVSGGAPLICPWQVRLRSWEALSRLRDELPEELLRAVAPASALADQAEAHVRWRLAHPDVRAHVLTSTWQVPLAWFTAFEDADRRLSPAAPRALRYRTSMGEARRRVARALRTLRRASAEGPVTSEVEALGRWLEDFHARSCVELDYGGLVALMDDAALSADRSAAEVGRGLRALAEGDGAGAAAAHERLAERWGRLRALEHAS